MKTMKKLHYLFWLALPSLLMSCEDVIDLELDQGREQLTVEAVMNTDTSVQQVILRGSVPFFDEISSTPAIDNAQVRVISNANDTLSFNFIGNGVYEYKPTNLKRFEMGKEYELQIEVGGERYTAQSKVNPVALWDSLTYEYLEDNGFVTEGYYVTMHARDVPGPGQCYWFRKFLNGEYDNEPGNINTAYDAGSTYGDFDGEAFSFPNSIGALNDFETPLEIGDVVRVEIQGVSPDFYAFLDEIATQMTNGGLFASPPANVRTNIINEDPEGRKGLGYFVVGEMEAREVVIQ